jgi:hypothetical protein
VLNVASQLSKYSSAYREVPMGEDFVNEFIMFSYDVPLSKHFVYRGYATFAERFRRDLNDRDQVPVSLFFASSRNQYYDL